MTTPPWFSDKHRKQNQNARSAKQEKDRASEIGGRVQSGSGNTRRNPQDIKTDDSLEQIKFTNAKSYRLTEAELRATFSDANRLGRSGSFVVEFSSGFRVQITEA